MGSSECNLSDFHHGTLAGVRRGGVSIAESVDLGFSSAAVSPFCVHGYLAMTEVRAEQPHWFEATGSQITLNNSGEKKKWNIQHSNLEVDGKKSKSSSIPVS